jgi:hypothetical protein
MDRSQLPELQYITPIENVPSIQQHGLLSHRRATRTQHRSVAMAEIQDRRSKKKVPGGRPLHEYVNLYINARNVMLSKVLYGASIHEVCVLRVNPSVLDLPDVVIADQNAASEYVRFAHAPAGLARIDHATVFAQYWTHPDDQIAEWRHRSAMCAEVLVPDSVDSAYIVGAYVGSIKAQQSAAALAPALSVTLDVYKFFK